MEDNRTDISDAPNTLKKTEIEYGVIGGGQSATQVLLKLSFSPEKKMKFLKYPFSSTMFFAISAYFAESEKVR